MRHLIPLVCVLGSVPGFAASTFTFNTVGVTPALSRVNRHLIAKDRAWMLGSLAREHAGLWWIVAEGPSLAWRDRRAAAEPALAGWLGENHPGNAFLAPNDAFGTAGPGPGPRGVIFVKDGVTRGTILELYVEALIEDELAAHGDAQAKLEKALAARGPLSTRNAASLAAHAALDVAMIERKVLRRFDAAQFVLDLHGQSNLNAAELRPVWASADERLRAASALLERIRRGLSIVGRGQNLTTVEDRAAELQTEITAQQTWLFHVRCDLDLGP